MVVCDETTSWQDELSFWLVLLLELFDNDLSVHLAPHQMLVLLLRVVVSLLQNGSMFF